MTIEAAVILPALIGVVFLFLFALIRIHDGIVLYAIGAEELYESYQISSQNQEEDREGKVFLWGNTYQHSEEGNYKNYIKQLELPHLGVFKGLTKGYNWNVVLTQISRKLDPPQFIRGCIRTQESLEGILPFEPIAEDNQDE